jgi:hypothetical protein
LQGSLASRVENNVGLGLIPATLGFYWGDVEAGTLFPVILSTRGVAGSQVGLFNSASTPDLLNPAVQ